ncbi:uncharacterized protein BYT42DRAFT_556310 [Radiomyces spectabilis]|uniref:uncharacterized protein n=1 Tax=Radiomyces spectabilis TaxID=64574 RepID=UPI002221063B|nr:uncharacterized protein BYT42DRAFT_556310 [Radiomyces spectabilis]KAI8391279.1 hypothetical protein BYT42DRAFT_556310 [Radiomyces spectabilis]
MWIAHALFLVICYSLVVLTRAEEKLVTFNDTNFRFFGRWHVNTFTQNLQSTWPGAYVKAEVTGTTIIRVILGQPTSVYAKVDDGPLKKLEATPVSGQGNQSWAELMLGDHFDSNQSHQFMLIATVDDPALQFHAVALSSEACTVPPSHLSGRNVEFIGHDLTLGTGTSHSFLTGYAWIVSDLLGVELSQIAYPNARLMDDGSSFGMETRYFHGGASYPPSCIVLFLARNDRGHEDDYAASLTRFLRRLHTRAKDTPILVLSEPLGDLFRASQGAVNQLSSESHQDIYFIDTTSWIRYGATMFLDPGHFTDAGHETFAKKLLPYLQAKLAVPPQPLPSFPPNPNLPGHWQTMDLGEASSIGLPGSVSFDADNTFTLWGSGTDISKDRDAFRYVYQSMSGNGSIEATVESHSAFAACAKAGIMLREHLALGSPHVMLGMSSADGLFLQTRETNLNATRVIKKMRASPPYRLRLVQKGFSVTASVSNRDSEWEPFAEIKTSLARDIYVGLAVTSCDTSVVSVAKFSNISLKGGVGSGGLSLPRFIEQKPN